MHNYVKYFVSNPGGTSDWSQATPRSLHVHLSDSKIVVSARRILYCLPGACSVIGDSLPRIRGGSASDAADDKPAGVSAHLFAALRIFPK